MKFLEKRIETLGEFRMVGFGLMGLTTHGIGESIIMITLDKVG